MTLLDVRLDSLGAERLVVSAVISFSNALRRVKMLIAAGDFRHFLFFKTFYFLEMSTKRPRRLFFSLYCIWLHFKLISPLKEKVSEEKIIFHEINPDITHLCHLAKSYAIGFTGPERKNLVNVNDFLFIIRLQ